MRSPRFALIPFLVAATITFIVPNYAQASLLTLNFYRITSNSSTNIASQLQVDAMDQATALSMWSQTIASNEVLFVVKNNVGVTSNIHEVYFDDGTIMSQTRLINSLSGFTNYGTAMSPANLPAGNLITPEFVATAGFGADAKGNPNNGVNAANDALGIVIRLLPNLTFADVQTALIDGNLRVGLHVGSIAIDGQSDSFVNNPFDLAGEIPEPGCLAVWVLGALAIGAVSPRRRNRI